MANVLRFTTHYVAEQIEPEYAAALYKADSYKYEVDSDDTDIVLVFGANRSRRVRLSDWRCNFASSTQLHAITQSHIESTSASLVHVYYGAVVRKGSSWTSPLTKLQLVRQLQYKVFDEDASVSKRKKPRTHAERYTEAVQTTHLIASELADLSDEKEFEAMLIFVLQQW
ncbi:hypothetical protein L915_01789 [Phytophthora nicotianae]|uniref:Uncharacterized protein n=1 Tax=Phytophthora nicotianae TaxID=4792 RepID=W2HL99_PHYNI|nr:hypothetical protein L915_01789 [Phytophthora nicotianae]